MQVHPPRDYSDINPEVATGNASLTDGTSLYEAGFNSLRWSGHLTSFTLAATSAKGKGIAEKRKWDAGEILTRVTKPSARTIVTYQTTTQQTVPFSYANLSTEGQSAFNQAPQGGDLDNLGLQRVNYIYGDRQLEKKGASFDGLPFRLRDSILGDIVNSAPVYVGPPIQNKTEASYPAFFEHTKTRPGAVYIGANDGMLHAFSAETGVELFSYIPSAMVTKLPKLSDPSYRHESFVDGKISAAEALVAGKWKTVLAAGMGGGAKGIFALDVTIPGEFMEGLRALFEFTDQDDSDMGYVLSSASIVAIGDSQTDQPHYFVIVPSGYNATNFSSDVFLFIISLDKTAGAPWILNKNYFKLKVSNPNKNSVNALSSPGLVFDEHGFLTFAYAGDLQGNIWRFAFAEGPPFSKAPVNIFTATNANNEPQAITAQPSISYAPGGGHLVLFGTGKYIERNDTIPARFKTNSFYGIRDSNTQAKDGYHIDGRNKLAQRTLTLAAGHGYAVSGDDFIFGDTSSKSGKQGWYLDFMDSNITGERILSSSLLAYGDIYFNTFTPNTFCNMPGSTNSYKLNVLTGKTVGNETGTGYQLFNAALGKPLLLTEKTGASSPDPFGRRSSTQSFSILNFHSPNGAAKITEPNDIKLKAGRLSWREIQNWQDLK